MRVLLVTFLFFFMSLELIAQPSDAFKIVPNQSSWHKYVRGFRQNHNFSLSAGSASSVWKLKEFGDRRDETASTSAFFAKIRYSFHLALGDSFGVLFGSSFGYYRDGVDEEKDFASNTSIHYPGFMTGLAFNQSSTLRVIFAVDSYLERFERLRLGSGDDERKLKVTILTLYDFMVMADLFYSLNWGLRLEGHFRWSLYNAPHDSEGKVVGAKFEKSDRWAGIGVVYHML